MLSIPRDLWVSVSEKEENRLGAVYRIIEMENCGKGASTVTTLVNKLFHVQVHYYVLIKMRDFISIIDALGGIEINLSKPVAGYPMGVTYLNGQAALAFVRDRAKTDDITRMVQAQILLNAIITKAFKIQTWIKFPRVLSILRHTSKSNIPLYKWFLMVFMLLFSFSNRIESYAITREMVSPFITYESEKVIKPDWNKIQTLIQKIYNE